MGRTLRVFRSDPASRESGDSIFYHGYDSEEEPEDKIEMLVDKILKRKKSKVKPTVAILFTDGGMFGDRTAGRHVFCALGSFLAPASTLTCH